MEIDSFFCLLLFVKMVLITLRNQNTGEKNVWLSNKKVEQPKKLQPWKLIKKNGHEFKRYYHDRYMFNPDNVPPRIAVAHQAPPEPTVKHFPQNGLQLLQNPPPKDTSSRRSSIGGSKSNRSSMGGDSEQWSDWGEGSERIPSERPSRGSQRSSKGKGPASRRSSSKGSDRTSRGSSVSFGSPDGDWPDLGEFFGESYAGVRTPSEGGSSRRSSGGKGSSSRSSGGAASSASPRTPKTRKAPVRGKREIDLGGARDSFGKGKRTRVPNRKYADTPSPPRKPAKPRTGNQAGGKGKGPAKKQKEKEKNIHPKKIMPSRENTTSSAGPKPVSSFTQAGFVQPPRTEQRAPKAPMTQRETEMAIREAEDNLTMARRDLTNLDRSVVYQTERAMFRAAHGGRDPNQEEDRALKQTARNEIEQNIRIEEQNVSRIKGN